MTNKNNFSDTLVEDYDLFAKVFPRHDELQEEVALAMAEHFKDQLANGGEGLKFLDIGAGYGFTSKLVANKLPKAKYLLNDYDKGLLNRSDEYMKSVDFEKRAGDIVEVIKEIPSQSIDAVYTAWVIHNFPIEKRPDVYKEIARILKPNGIFVNLEKVGNAGGKREGNLAQAIVDLAPFLTKYNRPDLYLEWVRHDLRDEGQDLIFTDDQNEEMLEQNGFQWKCTKEVLLEKVVVAIKVK